MKVGDVVKVADRWLHIGGKQGRVIEGHRWDRWWLVDFGLAEPVWIHANMVTHIRPGTSIRASKVAESKNNLTETQISPIL